MKRGGFTLIELLIYTTLIGVAGVFINGTLVNVLKLQGKQTSSTEVDRQINFVLQLVQKGVRDSSLIEIPNNTATTTLKLRTKDSATDPTLIYLSGAAVYMKIGAAEPLAITTTDINADQLQFTKVSSYPGHDSVSVNISFSFNTQNAQSAFSKTISSAVTRVSAATFDSDIIPGMDAVYNVGTVPNRWLDLNLSRNLTVGGTGLFTGNVGIGTASPAQKLHIIGSLQLSEPVDNRANLIYAGGPLGATLIYKVEGGHQFILDANNNGTATDKFEIYPVSTSSTPYFQINRAGRLGLGTASPSSLAHISGGTATDTELILEADTSNNDESLNPFITFKQDGGGHNAFIGMEGNAGIRSSGTISNAFVIGSEDTGDVDLQFITSDTVRMTILRSGGLVGIGTTAPDATLSVKSASQNAVVNIYAVTSGTDYGVIQVSSSGGLTNPSNRPLILQPNAGKVGIGTLNPGQMLEVNGGIKTTGAAASPPAANTMTKENIVKAWANFDGSTATIRSSFNVTSVTRTGLGKYTINWGTSFADTNYAVICSARNGAGNSAACSSLVHSTGSATLNVENNPGSGYLDSDLINIIVIGNQ